MRQLKISKSITKRDASLDKYLQEISREQQITVDEEVELAQRVDVLSNDDAPRADQGLASESLTHDIDRVLSTLAGRERDIVKSFFGIGTREMTLDEIACEFGLTRERVRQIKEKALRGLRKPSRSAVLRGYL